MAKTMLRLDASCLYSKFGFNDGDLFEGDHGHELLIGMVHLHLLPECQAALGKKLSTVCINTMHNPIRAKAHWNGGNECPAKLRDVFVEVEVDEALLDESYREARDGRGN